MIYEQTGTGRILELFSFNLIVYIISLLFFSSHHGNPCCCLSIHFVEIFYFEILFLNLVHVSVYLCTVSCIYMQYTISLKVKLLLNQIVYKDFKL